MEIQDHRTCPLRNLYTGQEATVNTRHGAMNWFKRLTLSPCLFNLYAEYIMGNAELDDPWAGIKTARKNINNLGYADDTTLMAESEEERAERASWWRWKRRVKKLAWNSTFKKLRSWLLVPSLYGKEIEKKWKQWQILFSWVPKITADSDCSHEIKRCLFLGRKVMTKLDSILKSREITLLTKVHIVKSVDFSVVVYGCEIQTIKKAERKRTDAFELWLENSW